jgi:hypothetical protein
MSKVALLDFFQVPGKIVLRTSDHSEVIQSSFLESERNFQIFEVLEIDWILHLGQNNTLLHLPNELFLDHFQIVFESVVNFLRIESLAVADGFEEEVESSLLRQRRHSRVRH